MPKKIGHPHNCRVIIFFAEQEIFASSCQLPDFPSKHCQKKGHPHNYRVIIFFAEHEIFASSCQLPDCAIWPLTNCRARDGHCNVGTALFCTAPCIALYCVALHIVLHCSWPGLTNCIAIAKLDGDCSAWSASSKVESALSPPNLSILTLFSFSFILRLVFSFSLSADHCKRGKVEEGNSKMTPLRDSTIIWRLSCGQI